MSDANVFVHRGSGGGCYALILVVGVFPVMGVLSAFFGENETVKMIGSITIFGIVALALAIWQLVREEHRVELGADRVRFAMRQTWVFVQGPEHVHFEVPLDASSRVQQINTRTPSSRGGWNHGSHLVFPGDNKVPGELLGSHLDLKSEYNRLTRTLKERLGERFTVEDKV